MKNFTQNKTVLAWIDEMKALLTPDQVVVIDGNEAQLDALRAQAVATGELTKLNEEKLPGCYLHRTKQNDVARVEDRTFICSRTQENAGPTNNWCDPKEMYERLYDIARGSYKGRTMYIIPYSMGPIGSPLAKIGIEVTDSIYVVLNMVIMTRVGQKVLDVLGDSNDWVRCLHCKCDIDPEKRYICQFPEDNTIISVNSGYGGNVLLGKKCFALRIASYQGWKEGWMAEHMLILGIENPKGEVKYVAAAFPSACGKTNLAMMIPPEYLRKKGYKDLLPQEKIQFSRMLRSTQTITPCGGKDSIKILLFMRLTGRAIHGIRLNIIKRTNPHMQRIRIPVSQLLLSTAPVFHRSLIRAQVFRFPLLFSADAVQNARRWFISPRAGRTACL